MPSLLQQLENNEAVLLMYLADELPADDRVEVEQMLASDAGLRVVLDDLRATQTKVMAGLRDLDKSSALPVSESVAVRQISRMMKQWQVEQLARRGPATGPKRSRLAWWLYPSATAAAVLIALVVWWGMKPEDQHQVAEQTSTVAQQLEDDPGWQVTVSLLNPEDTTAGIATAEQEVSTLSGRSDDASILMFDPGGPTNQ